jgi:hypothetical protein
LPTLAPIKLDEVQYTVNCTTFFDDKKCWNDFAVCRLHGPKIFKAHEYTVKSIKAVERESEYMHMGSELLSCVATITGKGLKAMAKSLEDPSDWTAVQEMIEACNYK